MAIGGNDAKRTPAPVPTLPMATRELHSSRQTARFTIVKLVIVIVVSAAITVVAYSGIQNRAVTATQSAPSEVAKEVVV
jgi:hypothetical protein